MVFGTELIRRGPVFEAARKEAEEAGWVAETFDLDGFIARLNASQVPEHLVRGAVDFEAQRLTIKLAHLVRPGMPSWEHATFKVKDNHGWLRDQKFELAWSFIVQGQSPRHKHWGQIAVVPRVVHWLEVVDHSFGWHHSVDVFNGISLAMMAGYTEHDLPMVVRAFVISRDLFLGEEEDYLPESLNGGQQSYAIDIDTLIAAHEGEIARLHELRGEIFSLRSIEFGETIPDKEKEKVKAIRMRTWEPNPGMLD